MDCTLSILNSPPKTDEGDQEEKKDAHHHLPHLLSSDPSKEGDEKDSNSDQEEEKPLNFQDFPWVAMLRGGKFLSLQFSPSSSPLSRATLRPALLSYPFLPPSASTPSPVGVSASFSALEKLEGKVFSSEQDLLVELKTASMLVQEALLFCHSLVCGIGFGERLVARRREEGWVGGVVKLWVANSILQQQLMGGGRGGESNFAVPTFISGPFLGASPTSPTPLSPSGAPSGPIIPSFLDESPIDPASTPRAFDETPIDPSCALSPLPSPSGSPPPNPFGDPPPSPYASPFGGGPPTNTSSPFSPASYASPFGGVGGGAPPNTFNSSFDPVGPSPRGGGVFGGGAGEEEEKGILENIMTSAVSISALQDAPPLGDVFDLLGGGDVGEEEEDDGLEVLWGEKKTRKKEAVKGVADALYIISLLFSCQVSPFHFLSYSESCQSSPTSMANGLFYEKTIKEWVIECTSGKKEEGEEEKIAWYEFFELVSKESFELGDVSTSLAIVEGLTSPEVNLHLISI